MQIKLLEVSGLKHAITSMRNPMDSWEKSDSIGDNIGEADMKLAQKLVLAGTEHSKFMRMIHVQINVIAPRYIWSEWDTYHYNTKNSCSTMHRLLQDQRPLDLSNFECEGVEEIMIDVMFKLNKMKVAYKNENNQNKKDKLLRQAKMLLPEGFLQLRTVDTNYAELRNMYFQRRQHRLPEWNYDFLSFINTLPYANEFIMLEGDK